MIHWQKQLKRRESLDLDLELQRMMGDPRATFRGSQRAVLRAIMRSQRPVLAIMPTGAGEGLLFMLPAFCASGEITLVGSICFSRCTGTNRDTGGCSVDCVATGPATKMSNRRHFLP